MNRKDLGKFVANLFTFRKRKKTPIVKKEKKDTPTTQKRIKPPIYSGIPTIQAIRMKQNRRDGIELKKRTTKKRLLLLKREEKNK